MAYLEKRVLKRGGVTWMARVRVKGFPQKVASFPNKATASIWAAKKESDYRMGKYSRELLAQKYTAAEMIDRYLKNVLQSKSKKKRFIDNQRSQLLWWKAQIGEYQLSHLDSVVLANARDELAGHNFGRRTAGTVNRYFDALNHVFNTALKEWGWLADNPLAKVKRPKEPRGRVRFLSDSERSALFAAAAIEKRKPMALLIKFALATGARKGEILTLKLKDVDLLAGKAVVYETKNSEPRQLHLSASLADDLREYLQQRSNHRSKYLFATRLGELPLNIENEWRRCLERAGIDDFRFHDLRHSFASYLAMDGASSAEIGEALGHKSLALVKRYAHLTHTHTASVVASMNSKIFNTNQESRP